MSGEPTVQEPRRKVGRPALNAGKLAMRRMVSLDQGTIDRALQLGAGKLSAGIRRAVEAAWTHIQRLK